MNENNRNTRTLIVSFVVAVMVLIPLRFVEVGQMVSDTQVLGVTEVAPVVVSEPVVDVPVLEAPYNEIENAGPTINCLETKEAANLIRDIKKDIVTREMESDEVTELLAQIEAVKENTCK